MDVDRHPAWEEAAGDGSELSDTACGRLLLEDLVLRGVVGREEADAEASAPILIACCGCGLRFALSRAVAPRALGGVCPACGGGLRPHGGLGEDAAADPCLSDGAARRRLLDRVVGAWAAGPGGVDPEALALCRAPGSAESLVEALVRGNLVAPERLRAALEEPQGLMCPECGLATAIGQGLLGAGEQACPRCDVRLLGCDADQAGTTESGGRPESASRRHRRLAPIPATRRRLRPPAWVRRPRLRGAAALSPGADRQPASDGAADDRRQAAEDPGQPAPAGLAAAVAAAQEAAGLDDVTCADDSFTASDRGRRFGGYRLLKLLARGGMGEVHLAIDSSGSPVAVKILRPSESDPTFPRRFEREGRLLATVHHPNVVALRGRGIDGGTGRPYMALEYVPGRDLRDVLKMRHRHRLRADEACYVLHQCTKGLAALHQRGIVHRDLKPANVLLTPSGEVKLADLGIASSGSQSVALTQPGLVMGTPHYVPPEAITLGAQSDRAWTRSADLYALGVLAYCALTGRPPFESDSVPGLFRAIAQQEPPPVRTLAPNVPEAVASLVERLLAKRPEDRPWLPEATAVFGTFAGERDDLGDLWREVQRGESTDSERSTSGRLGVTFAAGEVFGPFRIDRELGRGGNGIVYEAYHLGLKRSVALKLLLSGALATANERRRFLREAQAAGGLDHPNIVKVLDAGEHEGTHFLTMELVRGRPMAAVSHRLESLTERLALLVKVCDAVHHAHTRGVIHRDLKPDNVLVDGSGEPRVLDFGIAKRLIPDTTEGDNPSLTIDGALLGTLRYMPPEQAAGKANEVDVRSDVYALGTMFYELVTGGLRPFEGNAGEVLQQILFVEASAPSALAPELDLPWELDAIALRALEKDREARYQSALELRRDIERFLAGEPIVARRATVWYRGRKWVSRNRRKAAALCAGALVAAAGLGIVVHERGAAERARRARVVDAALDGWRQLHAREFARALTQFGVAQAAVLPDDVLRLPREAAPVMPPELRARLAPDERDAPRVTFDRLREWTAHVRGRITHQQANDELEAAQAAVREGDFVEASEHAQAAAVLAPGDPEVAALAAQVVAGLVRSAAEEVAAADSGAVDAFGAREQALTRAGELVERARRLAPHHPGVLHGLAAAGAAQHQLARDREQADRFARGRAQLARAVALREQAAQGAEAAARVALQAARLRVGEALVLAPALDEARAEGVRVCLALGALALADGRLDHAQLELEGARVYDRLPADVAAFAARLAAQDEETRAFRAHAAAGARLLAQEKYEAALRELELALAVRPDDPAVRRRRDLAGALTAADRAARTGDADAEHDALLRARALHDSPHALTDRLRAAAGELYERALAAARRSYDVARGRAAGWDEVIRRFESALALRPDGPAALRGLADARAQQARPDGMVLVSVPAASDSAEATRFYVDEHEVTRADYARFVAAGGYAKRELWDPEGWGRRAAFVDGTGAPGPLDWADGRPPRGSEQYPVTGVSWFEAQAYARWAGRRLPTEAEWVLAACFDVAVGRRRHLPWGDDEAAAGAERLRRLRSQGPRTLDVSPWGARDMAGNVSEWTWTSGGGGALRGFSSVVFALFPREVTRGVAGWRKVPRALLRSAAVGFRCAADVRGSPDPLEETQ